MKKVFIIILFISSPLVAQTIKPLTNYSFENIIENDEANHLVLEGCISLYSAVTELTKDRYPELGNQFYEMANTIYPYGIISLSKINSISYKEAEKIFFNNVETLKDKYINEMNKNGKKNGSYFKGSFLGDDLFFCHEVTKSLQLFVLESLGE
ncbi:uncharacterized protein METZ01_LOCUS421997 [marine metagenome]|uniref:Uncharacterized protein n=1 Tax=marine metagenome TaxID=408172 RepID=A0A382XDS8_9ZZZZ